MNKVTTEYEDNLLNIKNLIIQLVIFIASTITIINLMHASFDIVNYHDQFTTMLMILAVIGMAFIVRSITSANIIAYAVFGILSSLLTVILSIMVHFIILYHTVSIEIPFAIFGTFVLITCIPINALIGYVIAEQFDLKIIKDNYKLDYYSHI